MSIVTLTFDLWPPKSIGFILSSRLTCLPSLIKKSTTVKPLLCSQAYFHRCPVWPWPLTSKINRVHPLITVNMSCKFDKEICNRLVSMVFTSVTIKKVWLSDRQTHARTHTQTDAGQSDPYVPLCFAGDTINCLVSMVFTSVTIKKVWLSDRQTHARTHRQTPDKVIPMCRYASQATQLIALFVPNTDNYYLLFPCAYQDCGFPDNSARGQLSLWTARPVDNSARGQLGP